MGYRLAGRPGALCIDDENICDFLNSLVQRFAPAGAAGEAGIGEGEVKTITLGSLFDGIGGFPLAASRYGIKTLWASEIEPFPIKVTKIRLPDMKHLGDITKINGAEIEPVDIITFGSPCQDLSVAGKRAGLAGERSGLFMEAVRIIKEMRNTYGGANEPIRPRFAVWENVPGAFSSNKGEDFRVVLEEICRVKDETVVIPGPAKGKWNTCGCIMGNGYSIAWRILDAQYWGVPQRRRRIFLVADFGGQSAPEILFKRKGLSRYLAESGETREGIATDIERSVTTAGGNKVTSTLFAAYGTKWNGNSGAVTGDHFVMDNAERGVDGAKQYLFENHSQDTRYVGPLEVSPIVSATFGMGGNNQPFVVNRAYSIQGSMIGRADKNGPQGDGINEDVSFTLNTTDRHAVAFACNQRDYKGSTDLVVSTEEIPTYSAITGQQMYCWEEMANPLKARDYKDAPIVNRGYTVRRLTPLECERLQGFPDGWTDIPGQTEATQEELEFWRDVWFTWDRTQAEDPEKVKPRTDKAILKWLKNPTSDSAQYKALGNSVAVPCPEYVLEGIKEVLEVASVSDIESYRGD